MKRISLLVLGLCATAWASGCCCHGYYSRHAECEDAYVQREHRVRGKHRHYRRDKREKCDVDDAGGDCCGNCCDPCCDGSAGGGPALPMSPSTYDNGSAMMPGAAMGGGCAACGTTQNFGSAPTTYGGMPFDPGAGWTIQSSTSTPMGNEPVMAPASSQAATPITPAAPRIQGQGWAPSATPSSAPSSAPSPGPVPPPVSYNR